MPGETALPQRHPNDGQFHLSLRVLGVTRTDTFGGQRTGRRAHLERLLQSALRRHAPIDRILHPHRFERGVRWQVRLVHAWLALMADDPLITPSRPFPVESGGGQPLTRSGATRPPLPPSPLPARPSFVL